mmetsp:Transcript_35761/g.54219  ORF Transcript_35761/g.54219 Transcript_35761/m.54219 type:complete len:358 (-) Transcript_35761:145-1218(-)
MFHHQDTVITDSTFPPASAPPVHYLQDLHPEESVHRSTFPPSSNLPSAAGPYPLVEDDILLLMIQRRAIASLLAQQGNLHLDRLSQAALLLNSSSPYGALLDPRCHLGSPPFQASCNTSFQQAASHISKANGLVMENALQHNLVQSRVSGELPVSSASALKINGGTVLISDDESLASQNSHSSKETKKKRPSGCSNAPQQDTENEAIAANNDAAVADSSPPSKKRRKTAKEGMPRRPLTAYNLFFRDERTRILADIEADSQSDDLMTSKEETLPQLSTKEFLDQRIPGSKRKRQRPHGKIGFRVLATMIGKRWRELDKVDQERMAKYREIAAEDMKRYLKEMKEFREKEKKYHDVST